MPPVVQHERVRALRQEVVAVGRQAAQIRGFFAAVFAFGSCGVAAAVGFLILLAVGKLTAPVVVALVGLAGLLGVAGYLATLPLAADFRGGQARHLRHELAQLPDDQVRAALLALREARSGDTRKLAESLLSQLSASAPREVSPSLVPEGCGAEIAPTASWKPPRQRST